MAANYPERATRTHADNTSYAVRNASCLPAFTCDFWPAFASDFCQLLSLIFIITYLYAVAGDFCFLIFSFFFSVK